MMMLNRIVSIVGWVGTALVFGSVGIRVAVSWGSVEPAWNQYATYGAWAGLVCVLIYMLGQWRDVRSVYGSRQARLGTLSLVSIVAVLGILVAINYLASQRNTRWDLTANQVYSLSDQTVRVLSTLEAPVRMTLFDRDVNFDRFRAQLTEYEHHGRNLSVEYVDLDRRPGRAEELDVQVYGTLVIEYQDRVERITSASEQDITNALIKVTTGEERRVYFTQGHGERDPMSSEREGYATVAQGFGRDNYGVERLVLAQAADVPDDAVLVIVAGPIIDFFPPEIEALERYLARGGKLMVLVDPAEDATAGDLPNLRGLLRAWAIEVGDDAVVEASSVGRLVGAGASTPLAASYPAHPINERFSLLTAYPRARSVTPIAGSVDGRLAQSIVETGTESWADTNLASVASEEAALESEQGDVAGPVSLAVAVSAPATDVPPADPADESDSDEPSPVRESRLVAFGDSDFAANFAVGAQGNRDLFMNAVNWLAQQENLIAIRPREPEDRRITLTAGQFQLISLMSLLGIPGLIFGAGVYSWWRRR